MRLYIELYIQNKGILNKWFPHVQSNSLIVNNFAKTNDTAFKLYTLLLPLVRAKIVRTDTR